MRICIAYLAKPRYGGWVTYTAHLCHGLRAAGHEPLLVKIGNRVEGHTRPFGRGLQYQNITTDALLRLGRDMPVLITAMDKAHHEPASAALRAGAAITIHDPTELKPDIRETLRDKRIIVIRETMRDALPGALYLPHPYVRCGQLPEPQWARKMACAVSRIDFDKHTDTIVQANLLPGEPIDIYGFANTMYAHLRLKPIDADWQRNYHGTFDADALHSAVRIATKYRCMVDMSAIKGDGRGTQYTFLEAVDAGCKLVLNESWQPAGLLADCATTASDAASVRARCESPEPADRGAAERLLSAHDAVTISQRYAAFLAGR